MVLIHRGCGGEISLATCVLCGADFLGTDQISLPGGDYRATVRLNPDPGKEGDQAASVAAPGAQERAPTNNTSGTHTHKETPAAPIDGRPLGDDVLWPVDGELGDDPVPGEG